MRGGYVFGCALFLVLPAPAWALSPALTAALGNLLNAQLIAALVLTVFVTVWVPRFIRRMVLERELEQQHEVDAAFNARLEEHYFPDEGASIRSAMSDDRFMSVGASSGWAPLVITDDMVADGLASVAARYSGPDPAGYDFYYEFQNRIQAWELSAPGAPGQALGWGPEEFEAEELRVSALNEAYHIDALNASAWEEFRDDIRGAIDDELDGQAVTDEWFQEEFDRRRSELYTFLPAPVFDSDPDPLDDPEQQKWAVDDYRYAIT